VKHSTYKQLLCSMHINLDPYPFGGGVTLMDSCLCGVPFVTLPNQQVKRISISISVISVISISVSVSVVIVCEYVDGSGK